MIGASSVRIAACVLVAGLVACSEPPRQPQQQASPKATTYRGERLPKLSDQQLDALRTRGALQNF